MRYDILRYSGGRDEEVAELILSIQNQEAGLALSLADQPDLLDIASSYRNGGFWIALYAGRVVGTLGLLDHAKCGILKKFFVAKDHRGPNGPARLLFKQLLRAAAACGHREIFLDTPSVATRSHAFYRRAGFELGVRADLPPGYEFPDRDSLIFRLRL